MSETIEKMAIDKETNSSKNGINFNSGICPSSHTNVFESWWLLVHVLKKLWMVLFFVVSLNNIEIFAAIEMKFTCKMALHEL